MTNCNNDVDLLHKFIKSSENPPKNPLPNDTLVHVYVAGISCLMLILIMNTLIALKIKIIN